MRLKFMLVKVSQRNDKHIIRIIVEIDGAGLVRTLSQLNDLVGDVMELGYEHMINDQPNVIQLIQMRLRAKGVVDDIDVKVYCGPID